MTLRQGLPIIGFGTLMCLLSSVGQTYFIALFSGEIRAEFGLSHGELGLIYMIGTVASGASLIVFGRIVDHVSLNVSAFIVLLGLAAIAAFMGLTWSPVALALAIFGLRLFGQGMSTHVGITANARHFDRLRGRAVSIAALGHAIGVAVSPVFVIFLLAHMDWRQAWFTTAIGVVILIPMIPLLLGRIGWQNPDRTVTESRPEGGTKTDWTFAMALRDPGMWLRMPTLMAPSFIGTGIFFHQVHLADTKGWSLDLMAFSLSAFAFMTVAGLLVGGVFVDRWTARGLVNIFLSPLAASCLVLWASDATWSAPLFLGLMGFGAGLTSVLLGAIWAELYGVRYLGSIRAFATAIMVFSTGLAPFVMGFAIDRGVSMQGIAFCSVAYCLMSSVFSMLATRRKQTALRAFQR